jgi:hypothetical protein
MAEGWTMTPTMPSKHFILRLPDGLEICLRLYGGQIKPGDIVLLKLDMGDSMIRPVEAMVLCSIEAYSL